jgi:O-antigen/teichoic acid export membrane protein
MVLILLFATLANAGPAVLGVSLSGAMDRPAIAGLGEIIALVVTGVGLVLLLPPLGGIGAAIVSVSAYAVNFAWQLRIAQRLFGGSIRDYLIPKREDLHLFAGFARALLRRA